jgi:hypothetical protein
MKLIMENWKRFLKEAKVVSTDEPYLAEIAPTKSDDSGAQISFRDEEDGYMAQADAEAANLARDEEAAAQSEILNAVAEAMEEAVGDWIHDDYMEWPTPGLEDRETFLKELNAFSMENSGISVAAVLGK